MSKDKGPTQTDAQAGSPGKAAGVGCEVGGVHSNDEMSWLDLWALSQRAGLVSRASEGTLLVRMRRRGVKEREMARKR